VRERGGGGAREEIVIINLKRIKNGFKSIFGWDFDVRCLFRVFECFLQRVSSRLLITPVPFLFRQTFLGDTETILKRQKRRLRNIFEMEMSSEMS
jgi:hypothetical protein